MIDKNEFTRINNSLDFTNELINDIQNLTYELLLLTNDFNEIFLKEEQKLPYHINLIDELHANENAHSRILTKLLQQQDPITKRFEVLESFIQYIIDNYNDKEDFNTLKINKPVITQEKKRIDLWIRDVDYAIIFENKVGWADDKSGQIERYIDVTIEHNFNEKQIYVLYLPPTYEKEPEIQSWGKYYKQDIYVNRYLNISFKDDILPWLKKEILPNIKKNDRYLSSAIEQYIDHLEGLFSIRAINKKMNMELQNFIKDKLGITELEPELAIKIVIEKQIEMSNVINQLEILQNELQDEIDDKFFVDCYNELYQIKDLKVIRKIEDYPNYYPKSVGVKLTSKLTIWLGKNEKDGSLLFCQLNTNDESNVPLKLKKKFLDIFNDQEIHADPKRESAIWASLEDNSIALSFIKRFCVEYAKI